MFIDHVDQNHLRSDFCVHCTRLHREYGGEQIRLGAHTEKYSRHILAAVPRHIQKFNVNYLRAFVMKWKRLITCIDDPTHTYIYKTEQRRSDRIPTPVNAGILRCSIGKLNARTNDRN